jgi:hypothetical protein
MPTQLDQDRTREALSEFEAEHDRLLEAEARDLEDLAEELVGREARFTKAVILRERASERLRDIRADFDWERRRALRRLRDRLGEAAR